MSFEISPQATNRASDSIVQNKAYLPSQFTSTVHDTWVDSGLSITVPKGVHTVRYNLNGSVINGSDGALQMNARLYNVTSDAPLDNSERYLATGYYIIGITAPYSGSAEFDALVYLDAPTTFRVEILKESAGGTPSTTENMILESSSFIEYEEA